ncbi:MAG TPA: branched-chain amino acid ABC transporter permease [Candidatus Limnocylindrales bacterium]|nr:branched-chain amino acid ABC transporter permease [Candidatus Limnocylindrales bacterium]
MDLPQQLFNGIFLGSIYALFALGYTLVFGVLDVLNLAHAAVFTVGACMALVLVARLGLPAWLGVVGASLGAGLLGLLLDRVAFAPLRGRPEERFAGLISSLAMASLFIAFVQGLFGPNAYVFPPDAVTIDALRIAGARLPIVQLVVIGVSLALMAGLGWLVQRTRFGRSLRAVAENPRAAALLGIDVARVNAETFFISSALGGVAGALFALAFDSVSFDMGTSVELKGLAVIIVGGMGSLLGAFVGGLVLGLAEVLAIAGIGSTWRDAVAFGLLFLILIVRPAGLFGRTGTRRD